MLLPAHDLIIPTMPGGIIEEADTGGWDLSIPCKGAEGCGPLRRGIDKSKPPRKFPDKLVPVMKVYGEGQRICAENGKLIRYPSLPQGRDPKYFINSSRFFKTKEKPCIRFYRLRRKIYKEGAKRYPGPLMSAECKCFCDVQMPEKLKATFSGGDIHYCAGGILFSRMPGGTIVKTFTRFTEIFGLDFGRPGDEWYYEGGCYKTGESYKTGMYGLNSVTVTFSRYAVYARIEATRWHDSGGDRFGCGKTIYDPYVRPAWGYSPFPEYSDEEKEKGLHLKLFSKPVKIILKGDCDSTFELTLVAEKDTAWIPSEIPFCCLPPEMDFKFYMTKAMPEEECHECKVFKRVYSRCFTSDITQEEIRLKLVRSTSDMGEGCACYGEYYGEVQLSPWGQCSSWVYDLCGHYINDCGLPGTTADDAFFYNLYIELHLTWLPLKEEFKIRLDMFYDIKTTIKGCITDHGSNEQFHIRWSPLCFWPPPGHSGWTIWKKPFDEYKILPLTFGFQQDGYGVPDYCGYRGEAHIKFRKKS